MHGMGQQMTQQQMAMMQQRMRMQHQGMMRAGEPMPNMMSNGSGMEMMGPNGMMMRQGMGPGPGMQGMGPGMGPRPGQAHPGMMQGGPGPGMMGPMGQMMGPGHPGMQHGPMGNRPPPPEYGMSQQVMCPVNSYLYQLCHCFNINNYLHLTTSNLFLQFYI